MRLTSVFLFLAAGQPHTAVHFTFSIPFAASSPTPIKSSQLYHVLSRKVFFSSDVIQLETSPLPCKSEGGGDEQYAESRTIERRQKETKKRFSEYIQTRKRN